MHLKVLYEDNHLLVIDKPPGIATMGAVEGPTVHTLAAAYLKHKYGKPGNAYVGIVSRLDTFTSGVLVLARTSKAAARLSQQIREHQMQKIYLAVAEGQLPAGSHQWVDWVVKDDAAHRMRCVPASTTGAQQARLTAETLGSWKAGDSPGLRSLLRIELLTGRKHQIRLQLAARGHPVWGDRKYGAVSRFSPGIALHAQRLRLMHPTLREVMEFSCPPPAGWSSLAIPRAE